MQALVRVTVQNVHIAKVLKHLASADRVYGLILADPPNLCYPYIRTRLEKRRKSLHILETEEKHVCVSSISSHWLYTNPISSLKSTYCIRLLLFHQMSEPSSKRRANLPKETVLRNGWDLSPSISQMSFFFFIREW